MSMYRLTSAAFVSAVLLVSCGEAAPETSSGAAAPSAGTTTKGAEPAALPAPTPEIAQADTACTPRFNAPTVGLTVVMGSSMSSLAMEYRVTRVNGDRAEATSTMLIGPEGTRGASYEIARRDGFVVLEGVTKDARRSTTYGPELTRAAIMALKPGERISTTVEESSDFAGEAGSRKVRGTYSVQFVGCSDLEIDGRTIPSKVFEVRSISRSYNNRAPEGEREGERQTLNRYWVSRDHGWVIRNDEEGGSLVARSLATGR